MYRTRTGKRISTTRVGKLLHAWGFVDRPFTPRDLRKGTAPKNVSDETYGRDSELYVYTASPERRAELIRRCHREGINVNPGWNSGPKSTSVNIGVTYFKGWHWDE